MQILKRASLFIIFVALASQLMVSQAYAHAGKQRHRAPQIGDEWRFGIGGQFGDPIGATLKYWFLSKKELAVQVFGGYDLSRSVAAAFGDLLYHYNLVDVHWPWDLGSLSIYGGVGGKGEFGEGKKKTRAYIRIPVGVSSTYAHQEWELFAEIAPGIRVSSGSGVIVDAGLGIRYYFGKP